MMMKRKPVKIVAKREEELVEFASDDEERQAEWLEENDLNLEELNIPLYK